MYTIKDDLTATLQEIRDAGLWKDERELTSPQQAHITTTKAQAINFCANNYLGLADHPDVLAAASAALQEWGFGMASVRFICGTQELHTRLEASISDFLGTEETILYSSCFDANGGVFEVLFGEGDAIISDALNHASLIDGIRLSKAARYRYANADMDDLRARLEEAKGARRTVIVTDGVFSMDGYLAPLEQICDLADEYGAMVLVDDSHAVGFVGDGGRGTPEACGVMDRVDLLTGTLGKALGGASGGYVSGPAEVVALLRQRSRPYLFSNAVAPVVAAGSLKAIEIARSSDEERAVLRRNTLMFRELMTDAGFDLLPGDHPITPVMFPGDDGARRAAQIADAMLDHGVYVIAFSYPVVPQGQARIRVQLSAAHSEEDVRTCVRAFIAARDEVVGAPDPTA
ncbi:glycine C-acetyltransferase [Janibacter anophelis]|uniref:glycine C-acetyltransferase n=1 Tax=Janibacter anophelis TaxID=319054 RepID=UPI000DEF9331|nr:glycine C-acetyltransferase [Janibacter anophelis]